MSITSTASRFLSVVLARGLAQLQLVFIRQEDCLQTNLQAACIFDKSILASTCAGSKEGWSATARRTAAYACTFPAQRIFSTTGFTRQCFILFCAAGMCTLPSVSTDHGSAAVVPAEAAAAVAVAEEAVDAAGSAAMAAMAAAGAAAKEAGAMVAAAAASSISNTPNFFLSCMLYPNFSTFSLPPLM